LAGKFEMEQMRGAFNLLLWRSLTMLMNVLSRRFFSAASVAAFRARRSNFQVDIMPKIKKKYDELMSMITLMRFSPISVSIFELFRAFLHIYLMIRIFYC